MTDPTFVFFHIDKTGGMALRKLLAAQFRRDQIRPVPHSPVVSVQPTDYPTDPNDDLLYHNQTFVHDPKHRLVMGHWSMHIVVPEPTVGMTVLRNPVDRAASLWRYIVREQAAYGKLSHLARRMGMVDFLHKHQSLWVNSMTLQLAGYRWYMPMRKADDPVYFEAVTNMAKLEHVGVTEQLSAFTANLCSEYNWPYALETVNATKQGDERLPLELYELVAECSQYDVALYVTAKQRCLSEIQSRIDHS